MTNAVNVAVVFDANGSTEVYQGYGYHLPDAKAERPFGLSSYPAIVSIPSVCLVYFYLGTMYSNIVLL